MHFATLQNFLVLPHMGKGPLRRFLYLCQTSKNWLDIGLFKLVTIRHKNYITIRYDFFVPLSYI